MKNITRFGVFFIMIPTVVNAQEPTLKIRVEDLEHQVEYQLKHNPKQDMLEVFNQTGFMHLAERVEKKLDTSNASLAEGNELVRSMIRRIEEKDKKDNAQDLLIRVNETRSINNDSKIWAVVSVLSVIFGLLGWSLKESGKAVREVREAKEKKVKIYRC